MVQSLVDRNIIGRLTSQLQQVRKAITALIRISRFLDRQKDRLKDVTIFKRCISRFIQIAYCDRCTRKTPPMCFRTCNALVRGCYSPYYTVLNAQYRRLWIQVQRIVQRLNATVNNFLLEEGALLDTTNAVRKIIVTIKKQARS